MKLVYTTILLVAFTSCADKPVVDVKKNAKIEAENQRANCRMTLEEVLYRRLSTRNILDACAKMFPTPIERDVGEDLD